MRVEVTGPLSQMPLLQKRVLVSSVGAMRASRLKSLLGEDKRLICPRPVGHWDTEENIHFRI